MNDKHHFVNHSEVGESFGTQSLIMTRQKKPNQTKNAYIKTENHTIKRIKKYISVSG